MSRWRAVAAVLAATLSACGGAGGASGAAPCPRRGDTEVPADRRPLVVRALEEDLRSGLLRQRMGDVELIDVPWLVVASRKGDDIDRIGAVLRVRRGGGRKLVVGAVLAPAGGGYEVQGLEGLVPPFPEPVGSGAVTYGVALFSPVYFGFGEVRRANVAAVREEWETTDGERHTSLVRPCAGTFAWAAPDVEASAVASRLVLLDRDDRVLERIERDESPID